jgi:hypothetical protein
MKTYIIGYDLKAGQDYTTLIEAIKKISGYWWHHLDSTWLVRTNSTPTQIRDYLLPHIHSDDRLLVIETVPKHWASFGFSESALNWLHNNA